MKIFQPDADLILLLEAPLYPEGYFSALRKFIDVDTDGFEGIILNKKGKWSIISI